MKFFLLIRTLGRAGTEAQVRNLALGLRAAGHEVTVLTFYGGGTYETDLVSDGVRVCSLDKKGRWDLLRFLFRWISFVKESKPDVILSFLTGANLVAITAKAIFPNIKVFWGFRTAASDGTFGKGGLFGRLEFLTSRRLAGYTNGVICNSFAGERFLLASGYPKEKLIVINNGVDTSLFKRQECAASFLRKELHISEGKKLVGIVARLSPEKGHRLFLKAAAEYLKHWNDAHFLVIGGGDQHFVDGADNSYLQELKALSDDLAIVSNVTWMGHRSDMPRVFSALTVNTLCSRSVRLKSTSGFRVSQASSVGASSMEAMSNSLLESLACGTPCVATDVGDAGIVLATLGTIVPEDDAKALAQGWREIISRPHDDQLKLQQKLTSHVRLNYSLEYLIKRTLSVVGA